MTHQDQVPLAVADGLEMVLELLPAGLVVQVAHKHLAPAGGLTCGKVS